MVNIEFIAFLQNCKSIDKRLAIDFTRKNDICWVVYTPFYTNWIEFERVITTRENAY